MTEPHTIAALRQLRDEMRSVQLAAGQASVEGPRDFLARQADREATRCGKWADTLDAVLAGITVPPSQEPEK
jgi:hypothetical protein